ncbi:hypothetical protein HG15A2_48310 [Adhaeretor mobilis]|uniref:Uncharacterized protein n=1 Tax=Adhaeretor mobilis TaxID=1930276 RepID=A0A517N2X7_9BACT|nr:hypothetical protein HG15A2_48310 [Adhaeretor mobilis]
MLVDGVRYPRRRLRPSPTKLAAPNNTTLEGSGTALLAIVS